MQELKSILDNEMDKKGHFLYLDLRKIVKDLLPAEKQQIVDAYKEGHYHMEFDKFSPENYFTQKYEQ